MLALLAGVAGLAVIAAIFWCHDDWLEAEGEESPKRAGASALKLRR